MTSKETNQTIGQTGCINEKLQDAISLIILLGNDVDFSEVHVRVIRIILNLLKDILSMFNETEVNKEALVK